MRFRASAVAGSVLLLALTGCGPSATPDPVATDHAELVALLLSPAEAESLGGWVVTPDDGPVDGDSKDCTGAAYDWPDLPIVDHASQFLDRTDEMVGIVVKRLDGDAVANVEALRGALAPCTPESGELPHGAMIEPVGDDSFAYQSVGTDDQGDYVFSNMLVACDDLVLEVLSISYSNVLDQAGLEDVVAPAVGRVLDAGRC